MTHATDSRIAMFRSAIALAWADGSLGADEQELLLTYINGNIHLSEAQREELRGDVTLRHRVDDYLDAITDMNDRAHLINIADTLLKQDGVFSQDEKEVYDRIFNRHMSSIDSEATQADIVRMAHEARGKWQEEEVERLNGMSRLARLMHYLQKGVGL